MLVTAVVAVAATVRSVSDDGGAASGAVTVAASAETDPVPDGGDAADDPAIWVNERAPAESLIIGTNKLGGIGVYDLRGREHQYIGAAGPNNVDLRGDLVAAGDRPARRLLLFRVDPATRTLVEAGGAALAFPPYGVCMYRSPRTRALSVIVTSQDGQVEQWQVDPGGRRARRVRAFSLETPAEGCVADDEHGALYLAEETTGIWRYGADPEAGAERIAVDTTGEDGHLAADVEGLALAGPFVVASSQGDDSFTVYERAGRNRYVGRFRVQGVTETDGIDATTAALGREFPGGVFVAQDDDNGDENQNFKLVRWGTIQAGVERAAAARR